MSRAAWRTAVGTAILAAVGAAAWGLKEYRSDRIAQRPLWPTHFGHGDHREVRCTTCHHNFVDGSGGGTCYACHKQDPGLNRVMEKTFHDLCRGCHLEKNRAGEDAGPVRACSGCHERPGGKPSPQSALVRPHATDTTGPL